uniref:PPM-type phosphatase domain-containing protein n=1 Tax=Pyrodinium bahamense TaxID=73915 RepID=A0A7S0A7S4_9DINO
MDGGAPGLRVEPCWPWRGALFNAICLVYASLVAVCTVVHQTAAWGEFPALLGAAWLAVECWSVFLLVVICRLRLCSWLAKFCGVESVRTPPQLQRRTTKTTRQGRGSWFNFVSCEMQGWRSAMEDAVLCVPRLEGASEDMALFAIFDGHGGAEVSAHAKERLAGHLGPRLVQDESAGVALKQALLDLEDDLRKRSIALGPPQALHIGAREANGRYDFMGCTAAALLLTRAALAVVNVGDSRVLKCRRGECVPLTRDHKPESPRERKRIEAAGGTVVKFGPCHRVDYNLNLSRTLGDFNYKDANVSPEDQKISPVGDVTVVEIEPEDEFLVIACDGLFELMTWKSVCAYVHNRINHMSLAEIAEGLLDEACSPNVIATCGRGTDNESVVIVKLHES